jgi:hypothetical protein
MARTRLLLLAIVLLLGLVGCGQSWEATVVAPDGSAFAVDGDTIRSLSTYAEADAELRLEWVLKAAGHRVIETLTIVDNEGERHSFEWSDVARDAEWQKNGQVTVADGTLRPAALEVEAPSLLGQVQADITSIAPTIAAALGLPAPAQATGKTLDAPAASQVLLLFLDGFGYVRYQEALAAGLIPNMTALDEPLVALTVYPPCTSVGSAALLTGAQPEENGVDRRGIRKTEVETIFDVAHAAGLRVVAVEGEALAFTLRGAEMQLSGDRDGNDSTDDNVLANALAVLDSGMPDLLFVHFHGIDDAGHTYGPLTPEEEATIVEVDAAVGQLLGALPPDTLTIVFADHGMHRVEEEGRLGNHGHLIERDMFIPIFVSKQ